MVLFHPKALDTDWQENIQSANEADWKLLPSDRLSARVWSVWEELGRSSKWTKSHQAAQRNLLPPTPTKRAGQLAVSPVDNPLAFSPTDENTAAHQTSEAYRMKRSILRFSCILSLLCAPGLFAGDADLLAGKWSVKKVNDEGKKYTQTIEIKPDNKFVFQILAEDNQTAFVAQGEFKLEKLGPFKAARFFHIKAGMVGSDLNAVDDEYLSVYVLGEETWTLASNFDQERDQKPALDVYQRVKSPSTQTLVIDEVEMADIPQSETWFVCFDVKTPDGTSHRYYVAGKGYDKKQVTIPAALELAKVSAGKKCSFTLQLDDIDDDACGDEPDNRSTGEFTASERGSQSYNPEEHWRYTLRWHLK